MKALFTTLVAILLVTKAYCQVPLSLSLAESRGTSLSIVGSAPTNLSNLKKGDKLTTLSLSHNIGMGLFFTSRIDALYENRGVATTVLNFKPDATTNVSITNVSQGKDAGNTIVLSKEANVLGFDSKYTYLKNKEDTVQHLDFSKKGALSISGSVDNTTKKNSSQYTIDYKLSKALAIKHNNTRVDGKVSKVTGASFSQENLGISHSIVTNDGVDTKLTEMFTKFSGGKLTYNSVSSDSTNKQDTHLTYNVSSIGIDYLDSVLNTKKSSDLKLFSEDGRFLFTQKSGEAGNVSSLVCKLSNLNMSYVDNTVDGVTDIKVYTKFAGGSLSYSSVDTSAGETTTIDGKMGVVQVGIINKPGEDDTTKLVIASGNRTIGLSGSALVSDAGDCFTTKIYYKPNSVFSLDASWDNGSMALLDPKSKDLVKAGRHNVQITLFRDKPFSITGGFTRDGYLLKFVIPGGHALSFGDRSFKDTTLLLSNGLSISRVVTERKSLLYTIKAAATRVGSVTITGSFSGDYLKNQRPDYIGRLDFTTSW